MKPWKNVFVDAIGKTLENENYALVDDSFYIYRRETGIVIALGYDVLLGGRAFYIGAGAAALCDEVTITPDGQLFVPCYDNSQYAPKCGLPALDNMNYDDHFELRKYSKASFAQKLQENVAILRKGLLADLLQIRNMEDYFNFKVKGDGMGHMPPIPFPSMDSFFLCVMTRKYKEAGSVYLVMLERYSQFYRSIRAINDMMNMTEEEIMNQMEIPADAPIPRTATAAAIQRVLFDHRDLLEMELNVRMEKSKSMFDNYFKKIAVGGIHCD